MHLFKRISCLLGSSLTVMNDRARKPLYAMLVEIIRLWFRDGARPAHYFSYPLYRRDSPANIYAYVGGKNIGQVYDRINDPLWTSVLNNKISFDLFFRQMDIRLPKQVGFNIRNQFFIGDDVIRVSDRQQLLAVLELLVNNSSIASIFGKPTGGLQGRGCFKFDLSNISELLVKRGRELLKGDYVYQEVIDQHPKMAELHSSSVNTLRIDTYRTDEGEVGVMSAFARMGASKSCIDNASAGGCFVGVNLEQGTLMRNGYTMPKYGFCNLERHPDTEVVFDGFVIPFFQEAIMVAKRAAEMIPVSAVGWDIAISRDGPILIEGNAPYHAGLSEMVYGGYWRNPVFRRLIADHAPEMISIGRHFEETDLG